MSLAVETPNGVARYRVAAACELYGNAFRPFNEVAGGSGVFLFLFGEVVSDLGDDGVGELLAEPHVGKKRRLIFAAGVFDDRRPGGVRNVVKVQRRLGCGFSQKFFT